MRGSVDGEQYAQVGNPDPFAPPVWRSPVHRTPEGIIYLVQAARLIWRLVWFLIRHPLLDMTAGTAYLLWLAAGWPGLAWSAAGLAAVLVALRMGWPSAFTWLVAQPLRNRWRWWCYRRRWQSVLGIAGLAPTWQDRRLVPVLGQVQAGAYADLVAVRLVSGQAPKAFADRAEELAHGFGVLSCRVRTGRPGSVVLEFVRRDALAAVIPAMPIPPLEQLDLGALRSATARTAKCWPSGSTARTS